MSTTTLNGVTYRIDKMPARTQFHVYRRLLPILMTLDRVPQILAFAKEKELSTEEQMGMMLAALRPLASALSEMKDEDADYVITAALSVVYREQAEGKFAPVLAPNGVMMFNDIDLSGMVQLTVETIQENMGNFFDLLRVAFK